MRTPPTDDESSNVEDEEDEDEDEDDDDDEDEDEAAEVAPSRHH